MHLSDHYRLGAGIDGKSLNTMQHKFKSGDYVFYTDKHGATQATKVWVVTSKRVLIENPNKEDDEYGNARPIAIYVKPEKLILQTDWEKQNT